MNSEQREALREWFDTYVVPHEEIYVEGYTGYEGYDFHHEVKSMSQVLAGEYWNGDIPAADLPLIKEMGLDAVSDSEGVIDGFSMTVQVEPFLSYRDNTEPVLGWQVLYLSKYLDFKAVTNDREATGVEAAWNIVEALGEYWVHLSYSVQKIRVSLGIN